jgi:hypothetical protein
MTAPVIVALTLLASSSQAPVAPSSPPADERWQPWLGCWLAENDRGAAGARTCVSPREGGGVTIVTLAGAQRLTTETRVASDAEQTIAVDDCRGTERVRWSARGPRLYRTARVTCGSGAPRTLWSVAFQLPGPVWVDVQSLQEGLQTSVRVQRYHVAADQRLDGQRLRPVARLDPVPAPWTVEDVLELSDNLPADAVQAVIGEGEAAFDLNKRSLVQLADARVAERVIDLMVGLTYPSHFVIKSGGGSGFGGTAPAGIYDPFFAPILGAATLYDCYSAYAWAMTDYLNSCGAASIYLSRYGAGYYNGFYGPYNYPWYITQGPIIDNGGGAPPPATSEGRVVNGRGYTQVTPGGDATTVDGGSGSWGTTSSGSNGSGGSSGVSSGGYSGGSAGGDGGRMAMPRPPGQ